MNTLLDRQEKEILSIISNQKIELEIPEYLDKDEVMETLEDAEILWQSDNETNFCVLAVWKDKESPFHSMFYFSRFFNLAPGKTVVSHDATASDFFTMLIKLSEQANRFFSR